MQTSDLDGNFDEKSSNFLIQSAGIEALWFTGSCTSLFFKFFQNILHIYNMIQSVVGLLHNFQGPLQKWKLRTFS